MYDIQKSHMATYYQKMTLQNGHLADEAFHQQFMHIREQIFHEMDTYYQENPNTPPILLKSHLHTLMAKYCQPVVFDENPFFFEFGMREAQSWGISSMNPVEWFRSRMGTKIYREHPIVGQIEQGFEPVFDLSHLGLCSASNCFDGDHHTLGYTNLFSLGVNGLIAQARSRMSYLEKDSDSYTFCEATIESCSAVISIAEKFAKQATKRMTNCTDERKQRYLKMMAETADHIPGEPPQTFYEGLALLLFTREAAATLEGIGVSQLGHVDRLLGPLYDADLAAGRITEEEARQLIGIWMLHTDIKFDLAHNSWPETSTCIQLGGCDVHGKPIYNTVTRMFIEEHHRLGLVNPKLNCRYCPDSPEEFLQVAGKTMLAGHNNFVMINDDIIIPGLLNSGVKLEDARLYVNGGCQETMIEGFGHTEGVAFYASMPRVMDLFLHGDGEDFVFPLSSADTYEAFYKAFLDAMANFFYRMTDWRNIRQSYHKEGSVCPFFSATQTGCIESGKDYSHGGARYNFSTISLIGLATVVDSLYAIKTLVYDRHEISLTEFIQVLSNNWKDREALRRVAISLPKYGHNHEDADALANQFLNDFTDLLRTRKNERGGTYIPSLFVYYHYETFSRCLRATPDGRRDYDLISAGAAPGQLVPIKDVTTPVKSMQHMDFTMCGGGSAVLDVKLPLTKNMNAQLFAAFIRACGRYHCPTIQPNIVSQEELLDAKANPEKHKNLIVRICGLSAYFVALTPQVQDEIIQRNLYNM